MVEMQAQTELRDLLEHATWVRGLARRLTRDDASADDLAQEAWVAALRRPPADPASPRAWLAQVLRNASHMRHRGEARRLAREEAVQADAAPVAGADRLAEEVELGRLLAEEVLALKEPLRETLLLHFYRGLSSAEIGALRDLPPATVRARLRTGLEALRAALDRRYGARDTWLRALAPIAAAPLSMPTSSIPTAKGATMLKLALATALVAGTGAGAAYVTQRSPPPRPPANAAIAPSATVSSATGDRNAKRRERDRMVERIHANRSASPSGAHAGSITKEYIREQIQELLPLVQDCYEEALKRTPDLNGRIVVRFTIAGDPTVGGVVADSQVVDEKSTLVDAEVRQCIQESMYAARFPPPSDNGEVVVEYPFVLMPDDSPER